MVGIQDILESTFQQVDEHFEKAEYLNCRNAKIGGPGKVVEIDEAKFDN